MSTTTRIDAIKTPELWIRDLIIDCIHPDWHPGARPLDWQKFDEKMRVANMLHNAPIRLGVK